MEQSEQAAGERRVREMLIRPLIERGLMKPAGMTNAAFEVMQNGLCQRLAYMSDLNLAALEEQAAGMAGGRERDRFPIGQKILEAAAVIQPPEADASPLIRAVFAHDVGRTALAGGYAPELLKHLRVHRTWPKHYAIRTIEQEASGNISTLRRLDRQIADGGDLTPSEAGWRDQRKAIIHRCNEIAALSERAHA